MSTEASIRDRAIEALTVPSLDALSEQQVRGYVCVWGGEALADETAVNLGPRRKRRLDGYYNIYPRACRACTHNAALTALHRHTSDCPRCRTDAAGCNLTVGLRRLMGECRR